MKLNFYPKASQEELDQLSRLVKKVEKAQQAQPALPGSAESDSKTLEKEESPKTDGRTTKAREEKARLFSGGIAYSEITREPLQLDNPVQLLLILMPEIRPYKWQYEELMRMAGYLTPGKYLPEDKVEINRSNPYNAIICAANGSGKDAILIAAFALWFVLTGARNRCIITSSSFDQLKGQTEIHIRELIRRANSMFGKLFTSIQFHHVVPCLGGEIKLFATDEPGMAEGYHAFHGGKLARIINEAKTVGDDIFEATERWTGVSHTLLVSSPGRRRFRMFTLAGRAIHYPAILVLGRWFFRKVTAFECPHIPESVIQEKIETHGINSPLIRSSIFAEFSDLDEPIVIPESIYDACLAAAQDIQPFGDDIGIGLDLAAGGDEDACFVRRGNKIIHSFFFRQADTDLAADLIDAQLHPWKWHTSYSFNADNGGVGRGIIDKLVTKGWRINRCNNQSPAQNKREFLNLGAESWMHLRRLLERKLIILPNVHKLREQCIGRYFRDFESTQGKVGLEDKKEARINGRVSPDRADAYVLCFWSFHPPLNRAIAPPKDTRNLVTMEQLVKMSYRGIPRQPAISAAGRFTLLGAGLKSARQLPYGK